MSNIEVPKRYNYEYRGWLDLLIISAQKLQLKMYVRNSWKFHTHDIHLSAYNFALGVTKLVLTRNVSNINFD